MRRSSPDSTSRRSSDAADCPVHLITGSDGRDPRRYRFDAVVAAFVAGAQQSATEPFGMRDHLYLVKRPARRSPERDR
jgi:hypothetical protein